MIDKEDAFAVTASVIPAPYPTTAPNLASTDIMAKMKKEMATLIAAAMAVGTTTMAAVVNIPGSHGEDPRIRRKKEKKRLVYLGYLRRY